jgi:hypothetical protein
MCAIHNRLEGPKRRRQVAVLVPERFCTTERKSLALLRVWREARSTFPMEFFIAKTAPGSQAAPIGMIAGEGKSSVRTAVKLAWVLGSKKGEKVA